MTLNLTINNSNSGSETITECNSYTWPANGNTYTASGTYNATLTNVAGCDSVATLNLTINTIDNSVTQTGFTFTANATGVIYQWIDCSTMTVISGETSSWFTATNNGSYAVVVSDGTCTDTSACYDINGLGVVENGSFPWMNVYPNPTDGKVVISFAGSVNNATLSLRDMQGKLLRKQFVTGKIFTVDLSQSDPGMYLLELEEGSANKQIRIIRK